MNEIIFEVVKILVMVVALAFARYAVPWMKEMLGEVRYTQIEREFSKLVYAIQERYGDDKTGAERRAIVSEKIKEFLQAKNISLTDEQIRELNDAAVKAMKIAQETGITIEATNAEEIQEVPV